MHTRVGTQLDTQPWNTTGRGESRCRSVLGLSAVARVSLALTCHQQTQSLPGLGLVKSHGCTGCQ